MVACRMRGAANRPCTIRPIDHDPAGNASSAGAWGNLMTIAVQGSVAGKIGFASHQNAVPVLAELEIRNGGPETYRDLTVELSADPPFLEPRTWRIDRLVAGTSVQIADRDVKLRAGMLAELNEALAATV